MRIAWDPPDALEEEETDSAASVTDTPQCHTGSKTSSTSTAATLLTSTKEDQIIKYTTYTHLDATNRASMPFSAPTKPKNEVVALQGLEQEIEEDMETLKQLRQKAEVVRQRLRERSARLASETPQTFIHLPW